MTLLDRVSDQTRTRMWWLPLVTGISWVIVSIVLFRFNYTSVAAISVLFGIVAFGTAATETAVAMVAGGGWRLLHLALAVLFAVTGVISFSRPGGTFVALAAVVSFYLIFRGISDITIAIASPSNGPRAWVSMIAGFFELVLGFWAAGSWDLSATLLVAWVAAAALLHGLSEIVVAFRIRP